MPKEIVMLCSLFDIAWRLAEGKGDQVTHRRPAATAARARSERMLLTALLWWLPACCLAITPFAGTWRLEPELTTFRLRSPVLSLDRGVFKRTDCRGDPLELPADGSDHPIKDHAFFDVMAVHIRDTSRVEVVQKLKGVEDWEGLYTVAPDQRSMTLNFEDRRAAKPVRGQLQYVREGDIIPGAHPLSGHWQPQNLRQVSASGSTLTIRDTEGGLAVEGSDGQSYQVKLGVQYFPVHGYLEGASILVDRVHPDLLAINRKQRGAVVETGRLAVSGDGQTMTIFQFDRECQAETVLTFHKDARP